MIGHHRATVAEHHWMKDAAVILSVAGLIPLAVGMFAVRAGSPAPVLVLAGGIITACLVAVGRLPLAAISVVVAAVMLDYYQLITLQIYAPVAATALACVLLGYIFLTQSGRCPWIRIPELAVWGGLLLLVALHLKQGVSSFGSLNDFNQVFVNAALAFILGTQVVRSARQLRQLLAGITGFAVLLAAHGLVQAMTGTFLFLTPTWQSWLDYKSNYTIFGTSTVRVGSFLINPDNLGVLLALALPLALGLCMSSTSRRGKLIWLGGSCVIVLGLLQTYSNASWAAAGAAVAVSFFLLSSRRYRAFAVGFIAAVPIVLLLLFPSQVQVLFEHATNPRELRLRVAVWHTGLNVIAANSLTGIGLGNTNYLVRSDPYRDMYQSASLTHPHNSFLEVAAMAGLPVAALFLALYFVPIIRCLRIFRASEGSQRLLLGAGLAAVVALSVNSMATNGMTLPPLVVIDWLILGAISSPALQSASGKSLVGSRSLASAAPQTPDMHAATAAISDTSPPKGQATLGLPPDMPDLSPVPLPGSGALAEHATTQRRHDCDDVESTARGQV